MNLCSFFHLAESVPVLIRSVLVVSGVAAEKHWKIFGLFRLVSNQAPLPPTLQTHYISAIHLNPSYRSLSLGYETSLVALPRKYIREL
ncbi:hypothetical protein EDD85DRAFT_459085 [Armillaria nabsnona]|nr:hypothetical protein EDD85DRAFT_459085 [Armillaria nabsnona]